LSRIGILSLETAVPANLDRTAEAVRSMLDIHGSVQARMPFAIEAR
jgi:hypothetical protein